MIKAGLTSLVQPTQKAARLISVVRRFARLHSYGLEDIRNTDSFSCLSLYRLLGYLPEQSQDVPAQG